MVTDKVDEKFLIEKVKRNMVKWSYQYEKNYYEGINKMVYKFIANDDQNSWSKRNLEVDDNALNYFECEDFYVDAYNYRITTNKRVVSNTIFDDLICTINKVLTNPIKNYIIIPQEIINMILQYYIEDIIILS